MKRSEIVEKLVNEGMSPTTLVKFTDKQLSNLAERMLGEALTTTMDALKKSPALQAAAKDPNQNIKLVGEEKPSAGLSKEKKSEVVKKAKKGGDIGKKGKGFEKIVKKAKESGAEDPEAVAAAAMWKNIKRENIEVSEWVDTLAEENFHSFTSKNEIMELINIKLNESETHEFGENVKTGHNGLPEFMTYDAISDNGPKIAPSKPKVEPGTKPSKPKTPFQPGPGVNPKPKALKEDEIEENGPKIAPSKPKVEPGTKPSKPKTPFQPGPGVNPKPKAKS